MLLLCRRCFSRGAFIILLGLCLLALSLPSTTPALAQPTQRDLATAAPTPTPASTREPPTCGEPTPQGYRRCEVVLTGVDADLDELVERAEAVGITMRAPVVQPPVQIGRRVVRRYRVHNDEPTPMPQIVARLREIVRQRRLRVGADPNRVIGAPWEISGSPWQAPGEPDPRLARTAFETQWALQVGSGIGLKDGFNQRRVAHEGAGIAVGVFDTAPYSVTATVPISITHAHVTFTLIDPPPVEVSLPATITRTTSSHGLFVVGLVHAVAPQSRISLVRVLDDEGHGTVFRLHQALSKYIEWERARPDFVAGVLNLSLSVDLDYASGAVLDNVETLKDVLDEARGLGFVVVTAAGNGSTAETALPAQFPAGYPGVLSVSSVNASGQRSCFANAGALAAPGGDGLCAPTPSTTVTPTPGPSGGCIQGDPQRQCLISLMKGDGETAEYGYWAGTSFSTALVSGLAALVLEQGWRERGQPPTPDEVAARLYAGAQPGGSALGYGRVDAARTLYPHRVFLPLVRR